LNAVCTCVCDIDYGKINFFSGNYDFWYQMSQIMQRQAKDQAKKREEKMKDLREFIQRFASNAAKSKQATSRKKVYDRLALEELPVTSRKFPYVHFEPARPVGNNVLRVEKLNVRSAGGEALLNDFSLTVNKGEKIAFVGIEHKAKSAFFDAVCAIKAPDAGDVYWGQTISWAYLPIDNAPFFTEDVSITDWLKEFSLDQDDSFVRGFLGRMLFSGDESLKSVKVISGGERVRCMLAKLMLSGANVLILDEPTNHLDLEAITSLNEGLIDFPGVVLFNSRDHEFVSSVANRIVEITPDGTIDRMMNFDDYLADEQVKKLRIEKYGEEGKRIRF
jgi:ATPase subunit of ABC transporter with duplicated ATPase domains